MKLYLDEMISPAVAGALRERGHDAVAAVERAALGAPDPRQLALAIHERRAFVTFNVRDFVVLAKGAWAAGRDHSGIVLVSDRRFSTAAIGNLVRALEALMEENPEPDDLQGRTVFLR